ncbi:MAG: peptide deformylase [Pseudomonadota bacterium]
MSRLEILIAPDPRLRSVAKPVAAIDETVRRTLDHMLEAMYDAPGIGLAAPQVGIDQRLVVLDISDKDTPPAPLKLINPEITWRSDERAAYEEGCLSLPNIFEMVERPSRIRATYLDETGERQEIEADGLLATCFQHEVDHLDGVLFVDYLSRLKRDVIMRKMKKLRRTKGLD